MLLTHTDLCLLVDEGVIDAPYEHINAASIDITMGDVIQVEAIPIHRHVIDLKAKEVPSFEPRVVSEDGYDMFPFDFILAHSVEVFNLPNDIAAEFKLKSSLARAGLQHALAGWCDCGWNGSQLTLELYNNCKFHTLKLRPGMKIGQMIFMRGRPVPHHASYATKGQYNGDTGAVPSKGVR